MYFHLRIHLCLPVQAQVPKVHQAFFLLLIPTRELKEQHAPKLHLGSRFPWNGFVMGSCKGYIWTGSFLFL